MAFFASLSNGYMPLLYTSKIYTWELSLKSLSYPFPCNTWGSGIFHYWYNNCEHGKLLVPFSSFSRTLCSLINKCTSNIEGLYFLLFCVGKESFFYTKTWHILLKLNLPSFTWWASRSTIITSCTRSGQLWNKNVISRVMSAYEQKPPPFSELQWWKPPPMFMAHPLSNASLPAKIVPPVWYLQEPHCTI